jgi:hypothetical protein
MSNYYAVVSALIFSLVALGHLLRIIKRWEVRIGTLVVSMSVSWAGLGVAAMLAIWGFTQLS